MLGLTGESRMPERQDRLFSDRWREWRNRLVADPAFQRWAARVPLVRRIAARRANSLFDLCAGFVYSQVLLACVRMDLFERLSDGPLEVASLSRQCGLGEDGMRRLLDAAVALRLLERRAAGRYGLAELGAALRGNPGVAAMIEHHELLYADLADPVGLLRQRSAATRLAAHWPYAAAAAPQSLGVERVRDYTRLMAASQPLVAGDVLDAHDFGRHRCLLDVGGGDGTFLAAVAARHPALRLQLFDLPAVVGLATERLAIAGMASRVECTGGSFTSDPLPTGADVVSLIRILHDHDDDVVQALLVAVRRVLPPGGTLVIGEPFANAPGAAPMGDAYFGLYLHAMGSGRPRSASQLAAMLQRAGYVAIREVATARPLLTGVLTARNPPARAL
jgi:demethylspheroidene O-methyltransferase